MKKLLAALCVAALPFAYWLGNWGIAQAQVGPAGLNVANFIMGTFSIADTTSANITLGDATHITWVCGFTVSGLGATAQTGTQITIGPFAQTNGTTGNMLFEYNFATGATVPNTPTQQNFEPCLPAPGIVTLTVTGAAGNTSTNMTMWGYKQ